MAVISVEVGVAPSLPPLTMGHSPEYLPTINATVERESYRNSWRKALALLVVAFWVTMTVVRSRGSIPTRRSLTLPMADVCEQPNPAALPSNLSLFTDEPGFAKAAANRLAGAVRIPTMCVPVSPRHRSRATKQT